MYDIRHEYIQDKASADTSGISGTKSSEESPKYLVSYMVMSPEQDKTFYDYLMNLYISNPGYTGNALQEFNKLFTYIALDYAKIKGVISVRTRRSGDSIRLQGRGCTKTLKKLFSESVPLEKRGSVLLLCDEDGAAAVEGFGAAERCAVDDTTETVLLFGIRND